LFAYVLATIGWQFCFRTRRPDYQRLFEIRLVGEGLSLVNPTSIIAGDGFKYYLLTKDNIAKSELLNSVLLSRFLTISSFAILAIISSANILLQGDFEYKYWVVVFALCLIGVLIFLSYLLFSGRLLLYRFVKRSGISEIKFIKGKGFLNKVKALNIASARHYKYSKLSILKALVLYTLHWVLGSLEIFVVLLLLGMDISLIDAVFIECGVVFIKAILSFIPAQVGVEELSNKILLGIIGGANPVAWVVLSVVRRARSIFWLLSAAGLYFIKYSNLKIKGHEKSIIYKS
jgi:hypothetical protein